MKKIAYIYYLSKGSKGLFNKAVLQAKAATNAGLPIEFIVFNREMDKSEGNLTYIKLKTGGESFIKRNFDNLCHMFKNLTNYIEWDKYHKVVLRYPTCIGLGAKKFFRKFGSKLILEHHSDPVTELRTVKLIGPLCSFYEKAFAPAILKPTSSIISVTNELKDREKFRLKRDIHSKVITNGINTKVIPLSKFIPFDGNSLKLAIVASSAAPWHGMERVLKGIENYTGTAKIILSLIGEYDSNIKALSNNLNQKENIEIILTGKKFGKALDEALSQLNTAISPLGHHRVGLSEACSLKTREYIARGIPFIYAYNDTDLNGDEPFALRFPSDESAIDIGKVIEFAKECSNQPDLSKQMREFAKEKLDWKVKLNELYQFACSID